MKKNNFKLLKLVLIIISILILFNATVSIENCTLEAQTSKEYTPTQIKTPQLSIETAWNPNGTAICSANDIQYSPQLCSDGAGGAIITWFDNRSGNFNIYAQGIDSKGVLMWTIDGVAICTASGSQEEPQICSDGAGGAIIVWQDYRASNWDIYAQNVDSNGNMKWTPDGVAICTTTGSDYPQICSDGTGGAIIVWQDYRHFGDIYAQRINSSGNVKWINNGIPICTADDAQWFHKTCSDGAGGALIIWTDYRIDPDGDIYAQKVDHNGQTIWADNGTAICTDDTFEIFPQICNDGTGGAIMTWMDYRSDMDWDIYAQKVDTNGMIEWTPNGIGVFVSWLIPQLEPQICSDGAGGAIITWEDYRNYADSDIYAQRVDTNGVKKWASQGIPICTEYDEQYRPQICSDENGGAIITWYDFRSGLNADIYAQGIESNGVVKWTPNGTAVCTADDSQHEPKICSDGTGGAIITWMDFRNEPFIGDIYCQRITETRDGGTEAISFGYNFLFFTILSMLFLIILTRRRVFHKFK